MLAVSDNNSANNFINLNSDSAKEFTFRRSDRKRSKYLNAEQWCHRGESCEYLHISENVNKEVENRGKDVSEVQVQIEVFISVEEKEVQTNKEGKCI